jgi:hypothetical protein
MKESRANGTRSIYGGELMSVEERNEYWGQMRHLGSGQERNQLLAQHREIPNQGAKALDARNEEAE